MTQNSLARDPLTAKAGAAAPEVGDLDSLYARGVALWNGGRRQEAVATLDAALKRNPNFPEALCMGGYILGESGRREAALEFYRRALGFKVELTAAWSNVGKLLFEDERYGEALDAFDAALGLKPKDADLWNSRAGALRMLGRHTDSAAAAREALRLKPRFAEAALNLGTALLKLGQVEEALDAYDLANEIQPAFDGALNGRALALRSLGRFDEARAAFEEAIRLGNYEAISGLGCLDLTLGDFERGWEGYEARWIKGKTVAEELGARFPAWRGPGRSGERVLVLNDHGLGDTIQFCRYLPLMAAAGVEPTFLCPPRLHRLLGSLTGIRLIDKWTSGERFDAQIAVSSLPRAFATRVDSVPAVVPYLAAEPERARRWAARIGDDGFKIGVVWQGNPNPEVDITRAAPLAAYAPLAAIPGVRLISLQKGCGVEQLADLPAGMRVESLGEGFDAGPDAFIDTAAAMANLDLVVTCDTSVAHLAGALARPTWVALKQDAEWRWLRDRDDSPWYPTMRLFRQTQRADWCGVFAEMAAAVRTMVVEAGAARTVEIPSAVGELLDKIAILEIKAQRIDDDGKLANVRRELQLLTTKLGSLGLDRPALAPLEAELAGVNQKLWDIEDDIRLCEDAGEFGERFVGLARAVYVTNDRRAAIKREINRRCDSAIVEEKHYARARPATPENKPAQSETRQTAAEVPAAEVTPQAVPDWFSESIAACQAGNDFQRRGEHTEALTAYDRAIALNPLYPAALNNRGVSLLAMREAAQAVESFSKALRLQPDFAEALYNRGNALRELKRCAEALADYDRAISIRPSPLVYNNRGAALQDLGRPAEALDSYDRALAASPTYGDALENKAVLQAEFGDIAAARQSLEDLLKTEPRRTRAHFHLARMKRVTRDDPQLAILEGLARERSALSETAAIDVSFALGKAYDDIGDYPRAFARFAEGNALKRAGIVYNEIGTLAHLQRVSAAFTQQTMNACHGFSDSTAAPIFIFGMPRSGSTLVEQILSRHPEISARGEIDAFEKAMAAARGLDGAALPFPEMASRLSAPETRALARGYLQELGVEEQDAKRTTDKKPSNFLFAGLIRLALPKARLIHTRRDPIDTCWSCFSHRFGASGFASSYDLGELGRFYRAYTALMEHWRQVLPEGAILTVDYEDVVADLGGQTRRILEFCGLDWNEDCLRFQDSRRHVATASAEQVRRPIYKDAVGRGRRYERFLGPLVAELGALADAPGVQSRTA